MREATVIQIIETPIEKLYAIIKDMNKYPEFMRDVTEVQILEKYEDGTTKTKWEVDFEGTPFFWIEIDRFDEENFKITYISSEDPQDQTDSDVDHIEGYWELKDFGEETKVTLNMQIDMGIPALEKLVGEVLEKKLKENLEMMLDGIKKKLGLIAISEENCEQTPSIS